MDSNEVREGGVEQKGENFNLKKKSLFILKNILHDNRRGEREEKKEEEEESEKINILISFLQ